MYYYYEEEEKEKVKEVELNIIDGKVEVKRVDNCQVGYVSDDPDFPIRVICGPCMCAGAPYKSHAELLKEVVETAETLIIYVHGNKIYCSPPINLLLATNKSDFFRLFTFIYSKVKSSKCELRPRRTHRVKRGVSVD
jgi:hypothetical protein